MQIRFGENGASYRPEVNGRTQAFPRNGTDGMDIRTWLAGQAAMGVAGKVAGGANTKQYAQASVRVADAIIESLNEIA